MTNGVDPIKERLFKEVALKTGAQLMTSIK